MDSRWEASGQTGQGHPNWTTNTPKETEAVRYVYACMCVILREKEIKPYEDTQLGRLRHEGINLISGHLSAEVNEDLQVPG